VIDINKDGLLEVLVGGFGGCVWAWTANGNPLGGYPLQTDGDTCNADRIGGPLAIGDVNDDGVLDIVAGTNGVSTSSGDRGKVFVWNSNGNQLLGWPKEMGWNSTYGSGTAEVTSVALGNVSDSSELEVIAGTTNNASNGGASTESTPNLYVWTGSGVPVGSFPTGYKTAGIWGAIAVANISGDGHVKVITGRDHLYAHAYDASGQYLTNWPVRVFVNLSETDYDRHKYIEFTRTAPSIGDLEGDGIRDIVLVGHVRDPLNGHAVIANSVVVLQPNGQSKAG
jgi:hypothetical protein